MIGKLDVLLTVAILCATIIALAVFQNTLKEQYGIEIPIVQDIWSMVRDVLSAIKCALMSIIDAMAQGISAPFLALKTTLIRVGLPLRWATSFAIAILVGGIVLAVLAILKIAT